MAFTQGDRVTGKLDFVQSSVVELLEAIHVFMIGNFVRKMTVKISSTFSSLTLVTPDGPPSLEGFEPAALYTGCFARFGFMTEVLCGKQPNFVAPQANECHIPCVIFVGSDRLKRHKKYLHGSADHAFSPLELSVTASVW